MSIETDPCEMTLAALATKAFKPLPSRDKAPWSDEETELVLLQVPTWENAARLARLLGRTEAAILTIYAMTYSGNWLKKALAGNEGHPGRNNVHLRIAAAKKKLGITVGHRPK